MAQVLERLEFGKLCVSADGPILNNAESRALAASTAFPARLRGVCTPRAWDLSEDRHAIEAARRFGGTLIVVPVQVDGAIVRIGAHFRLRAEDGEGVQGREFWRARFVCDVAAPGGLTSIAAALVDPPLRGWTSGETAAALPVSISSPSLPSSFDIGDWCAHALGAFERGMTVSVVAPVDAGVFFALAAVLEAALPPTVRPLFSAGWGVSPDRGRQLMLSCCADGPPHPA